MTVLRAEANQCSPAGRTANRHRPPKVDAGHKRRHPLSAFGIPG